MQNGIVAIVVVVALPPLALTGLLFLGPRSSSLTTSVLGEHAGRCQEYIFERRSNTLQYFLISLVLSAVGVYFTFLRPLIIPGSPLARDYPAAFHGSVMLTFLTLAFLHVTGPQVINKKNVKDYVAAYGVMTAQDSQDSVVMCTTCEIPRVVGSHHCRICGKCIANFDHHCVWINGCVARANFIPFVAFLVSSTGLAGIFSVLCFKLTTQELTRYGVDRSWIREAESSFRPISKFECFFWCLNWYPVVVSVGLFSGVVTLVLAGFTLFSAAGRYTRSRH